MGSNIYETMGNTLIHLRLKNLQKKPGLKIAKPHSGHYLVKKNKTFSENVVYRSSTMLPSVTNAYDGSKQILLNLTQFITLGTKSNNYKDFKLGNFINVKAHFSMVLSDFP